EALGAPGIVGAVGGQLVRGNDRQELLLMDRVALLHEETADLTPDLRTDDHVVGGDDAGQDEHEGSRRDDVVDTAGHEHADKNQRDGDPPTCHASSMASPRAISSWMCRTYASGEAAVIGIGVSAAMRRRKSAVAKKKTRLPTRLRWVRIGSTGRKTRSRTPRSMISRTTENARIG